MIIKPWKQNGITAGFGDKALGWDQIDSQFSNPITKQRLKQTHSKNVFYVTESDDCTAMQGDALVTKNKNLVLVVVTADCIPLLATGDAVIGACHAGWRGVAQNIIAEWIHKMEAPRDTIRVALGPSIGLCHFEVGLDVATTLSSCSPHAQAAIHPHPDPKKRFVDLISIAKDQLISVGVSATNISINSPCTYCEADEYHSYRRKGPGAGRQFSFIAMT